MNLLYPRAARRGTPHRVVITGAGIITAFGCGWRENAEGFREGRTTFRPVTLFDASKQRAKIAAEAELPGDFPGTRWTARQMAKTDRAFRLLLAAGCEAWNQCGWDPGAELPVVLGTTSGGMTLGQQVFQSMSAGLAQPRRDAWRVHRYQAHAQALDFANALGFATEPTLIANACASGANAIGHAWELIRNGRAERVLTGGYDALCQLVFAGFDSLQALSVSGCRPFDKDRDGLSLGEGAAVFALENLASAEKRGARILGEIAGYSAATDIHHLTQPKPDGEAAVSTMAGACAAAGIQPREVGYLNAHGTGTPLNDSAEAAAICAWAGPASEAMRVSSTKASVGHLLGAAGAVEAAVCLMSLQGQWLPPTRSILQPDPACQFRLVREPEQARFDYALSNSFGFGGANASLVLRRWAE